MSSVEKFFYRCLSEDQDVAAKVADRIFPNMADQETPSPYVTFRGVSGQSTSSLNGPSGLAQDRYQVDAWADTLLEASELRESIRLALQGFTGALASLPDFVVQELTYSKGPTLFEADSRTHHLVAEFVIGYKETKRV